MRAALGAGNTLSLQEVIAFGIVALAVLSLAIRFYRSYLAGPVSGWLLGRGKVKWAMRVKAQSAGGSCGNCPSACGPEVKTKAQ
ncbi:MAG: hypothetical protein H7222_02245 [Methylotenera sp.]|nr:hypothetical protein [Oligoflexia bacterium]